MCRRLILQSHSRLNVMCDLLCENKTDTESDCESSSTAEFWADVELDFNLKMCEIAVLEANGNIPAALLAWRMKWLVVWASSTEKMFHCSLDCSTRTNGRGEY